MTSLNVDYIANAIKAMPSRQETAVLVATDIAAFTLAIYLGASATQLISPAAWERETTSIASGLMVLVAMFGVIVIRLWGLEHYSRRNPFWDEVYDVIRTVGLVALGGATVLYFTGIDFPGVWFLTTWLSAVLLVPSARAFLKGTLISLGFWQLPTIVIGAGSNARGAAAALESEYLMGYFVTAFLAPPGACISRKELAFGLRKAPLVRMSADPVAQIRALGRTNVIVALEKEQGQLQEALFEALVAAFPNLSIVPDAKGLPFCDMDVGHFLRTKALFLRPRNNLARRGSRAVKRLFDIVGASILLVLLAPLFLLLSYKVAESGQPIFFGHRRVGRGGDYFPCYKFRTMVPDADEVLQHLLDTCPRARAEWEKDFKLRKDPRITRFGAFLRKSSLDELPQLWNVLKGDMSLVGPRPIVEGEIVRYGDQFEYYKEVRPGITGVWQISGRNDTNYINRVYLDSWYVQNWSLWYDIVILLKTVKVVLGRTGAY